MNQILVAFQVVSPIFLIIGLGYFLKLKKVINDDFIQMAMKVVFTVCLPGLLFLKVAKADVLSIFNGDNFLFSIFVLLSILVMFLISKIFAVKYVDKSSQGAFIQGSFRSNYLIIGYSVLYSLFGDLIIARMALTVIIAVPLYNILGILVLSEDKDKSVKDNIKIISNKIIRNPLILGILLGFIFSLLKIELPIILESTIGKLGATATPLGLIGIGGYLTIEGLKSNHMTYVSVLFKIVLFPLIGVIAAILLGYNYVDTTILFILFGSPAAISSFIMANVMGGDSEMAANIVIISTALSLFTFIIGLSSIAMYFN